MSKKNVGLKKYQKLDKKRCVLMLWYANSLWIPRVKVHMYHISQVWVRALLFELQWLTCIMISMIKNPAYIQVPKRLGIFSLISSNCGCMTLIFAEELLCYFNIFSYEDWLISDKIHQKPWVLAPILSTTLGAIATRALLRS